MAAAGRGVPGGPCNTTRLRLLLVLPSAPGPRRRPWAPGGRSRALGPRVPGRGLGGAAPAPFPLAPGPALPGASFAPSRPVPAPRSVLRRCRDRRPGLSPSPRHGRAPPRGSPSANGDNKVFGTSCGPGVLGRGEAPPRGPVPGPLRHRQSLPGRASPGGLERLERRPTTTETRRRGLERPARRGACRERGVGAGRRGAVSSAAAMLPAARALPPRLLRRPPPARRWAGAGAGAWAGAAPRGLATGRPRRSEALAGAPLDTAAKEYSPKVRQLVQDIAGLTLLEVAELNALLKVGGSDRTGHTHPGPDPPPGPDRTPPVRTPNSPGPDPRGPGRPPVQIRPPDWTGPAPVRRLTGRRCRCSSRRRR